jgi:hypothetical protein
MNVKLLRSPVPPFIKSWKWAIVMGQAQSVLCCHQIYNLEEGNPNGTRNTRWRAEVSYIQSRKWDNYPPSVRSPELPSSIQPRKWAVVMGQLQSVLWCLRIACWIPKGITTELDLKFCWPCIIMYHYNVTNLIHIHFRNHFIVSWSSTCFGRQASIFRRHYTSRFCWNIFATPRSTIHKTTPGL